jgi:tetratricopeptide (TPR) repeat protein
LAKRGKQKKFSRPSGQPASPETLQNQLDTLLQRQQYRQALAACQNLQRSHPDLKVRPSEAEIWVLRGQQELQAANPSQAEASFRKALELGLMGESHYWLAKCLMEVGRSQEALDLLKTAFDRKELSKDYAGCYLKLLALQGDTTALASFIDGQSKQFLAPQLHWARGWLALKEGKPDAALAHFQKMKRGVTPGDNPAAWIAYAQQQLEDWDAAAVTLQLGSSSSFLRGIRLDFRDHPAIQRLGLYQAASTGRSLVEALNPRQQKPVPLLNAALVAEVTHLVESDELEDAADALAQLEPLPTDFPELEALMRPLLMLAGKAALQQDDLDAAEAFWTEIVNTPPFDPLLAVNLHYAQQANQSYPENQRLLARLKQWLDSEAKHNPQAWPEQRLHPTQAKLFCWMADGLMAMSKIRQGLQTLERAVRLCPDSPEVIGRQGLKAHAEGHLDRAVDLLVRSLEAGCRYPEVYEALLICWDKLGNPQARREAQQRFGKSFGDITQDADTGLTSWEEALSIRSYPLFEKLVQENKSPTPAVQACRIFLHAVEEYFETNERVSFNSSVAETQWDRLLKSLDPLERGPVLQTIFLCLHLLAKRQKGLAALENRYLDQLSKLADEYPELRPTELAMAAIRGTKLPQLEARVQQYLRSAPQPGRAIAQLQLKVRRFGCFPSLAPQIEDALQKDAHNPLLLLAQATTFRAGSKPYNTLKEQGFELARRLQDAEALQAFREEEALQSISFAKTLLPGLPEFGGSGQLDIEDFVRRMAEQIAGRKLSAAELNELLPHLEDAFGEFSDVDFDDGSPFGDVFPLPPPTSSHKGKKQRRRGF